MSTLYAMSRVSTVSTVSTIYSAVLPPSLMLFFRYESSYNVSLHFAGFVHKRGGKEKYTPFFLRVPLSFMGNMIFIGLFIFRVSGFHEIHYFNEFYGWAKCCIVIQIMTSTYVVTREKESTFTVFAIFDWCHIWMGILMHSIQYPGHINIVWRNSMWSKSCLIVLSWIKCM